MKKVDNCKILLHIQIKFWQNYARIFTDRRDISDTYFVDTSAFDLQVTAYASGAYTLFRDTKVTRSSVHKKWFKKK